jgi:hypothetical protein
MCDWDCETEPISRTYRWSVSATQFLSGPRSIPLRQPAATPSITDFLSAIFGSAYGAVATEDILVGSELEVVHSVRI